MSRIAEVFNLNPEGTLAFEGATARRRRVMSNPRQREALAEAHRLYDRAVLQGDRRAGLTLHEALTTSDLFQNTFGAVLDIEMMKAYDTAPKQWTNIATETKVRNFKPKALRSLVGTNYSLPRVPERTAYPVAQPLGRNDKFVKVGKYGERYGYTFEARINDDLDQLREVPAQWAGVAARTEDDTICAAMFNLTTGAPNATSFAGALGTGALTATNLQAAYNTATIKRDTSGRLISAPQMQLVVGPALQFQAQVLLSTAWIRNTNGSQQIQQENPFSGLVKLTVMANLPGNAWFLIPVPTAAARPAFFGAFLTGYETPDVRQASNAGQSVNGGPLSPEEGSFESDTVDYRVRHIVGGAAGDSTFIYASDGAGS